MEERWIVLNTYADIKDANADASLLKASGIDCFVNWDYAEQAFWIVPDNDVKWISLDVKEEFYEEAAELLALEPQTVESFYEEQQYSTEVINERRKRGLFVWGGLVTGVILLKVIFDLI